MEAVARWSAACPAGAVVSKMAEVGERAANSGRGRDGIDPQAVIVVEIVSAQAVTVVPDLILEADGAARCRSRPPLAQRSHAHLAQSQRIYTAHIAGDFAVNVREPPLSWRVGQA